MTFFRAIDACRKRARANGARDGSSFAVTSVCELSRENRSFQRGSARRQREGCQTGIDAVESRLSRLVSKSKMTAAEKDAGVRRIKGNLPW